MGGSPSRVWRHRSGELELGSRTRLMGILNVTPDSFSDGGKFDSPNAAVEQVLRMAEEGTEILDVGAESTRPGSKPIAAELQLERLLPVVELLVKQLAIPISIDTTSSVVAEACLDAGASVINDVSGFTADSRLPEVCAEYSAGIVLMHMQGSPQTMQQAPHYENLLSEVYSSLQSSVKFAMSAGINRESILVDPGVGFGKSFEHNYELIGNLAHFQGLGAGVLVGTSRKGFTGEFNTLPADCRQYSTAATVAISILHGADVVRVHDVNEMKQVADICDRFRELQRNNS